MNTFTTELFFSLSYEARERALQSLNCNSVEHAMETHTSKAILRTIYNGHREEFVQILNELLSPTGYLHQWWLNLIEGMELAIAVLHRPNPVPQMVLDFVDSNGVTSTSEDQPTGLNSGGLPLIGYLIRRIGQEYFQIPTSDERTISLVQRNMDEQNHLNIQREMRIQEAVEPSEHDRLIDHGDFGDDQNFVDLQDTRNTFVIL